MAIKRSHIHHRRVFRSRKLQVEIIGTPGPGLRDVYHFLIGASWWLVLGGVAFLFLFSNLLFAIGYLSTDGLAGAKPGSFWDAFFFSIQTMGTIGYGVMYPKNFFANILVTLESIVGLLGLALATGLTFAKFSRPTARLLFSRVAVIAPRDGVPTLMFRVANERVSHVVEAQLRVTLLRDELTKEGESIRKIHDLSLIRSQSPAFALSWTVLHPIGPNSPLHGATPKSLLEQEIEIVVSLTGIDETLSQSIHARHSYGAEEIVFNARFADVFSLLPNGERTLDLSRFHETVPIAEPQASDQADKKRISSS